jgi:glycosyltransferase involved in cell wall biosynthesis
VHYVRENRPGLSWARNCGLHHAGGEIVAYIDDDELASPRWLAELVRGFRIINNVACVTGAILPAEIETQAQDWFEQFGGFSKGRGFEKVIFNLSTHPVQNPLFPAPPFGAGGNMAFNASILRTFGGFDVALGAGTQARGAEDTAAFFDVISKGYSLVFQPAALVRHFHYREYEGLNRQLYGYGVGLTAFYSRCLICNPLNIVDLVRIIPKALDYFLNPHSSRHERMSSFPKDLTKSQFRGMIYGPVAYLRSRLQARRLAR